jgi:hypothetical protein
MEEKTIKVGKEIRTCHDEDCPQCGFPETIIIRNARTMKPLRIICSKGCGWWKKIKIKN